MALLAGHDLRDAVGKAASATLQAALAVVEWPPRRRPEAMHSVTEALVGTLDRRVRATGDPVGAVAEGTVGRGQPRRRLLEHRDVASLDGVEVAGDGLNERAGTSGRCLQRRVGHLVGHAAVDLVAEPGEHRHRRAAMALAIASLSNVASSLRAPPPRMTTMTSRPRRPAWWDRARIARRTARDASGPCTRVSASTLEALARNSVEAYFHSVSILHDGMRRQLFSERFRRELQGYAAIEVLKRHAARAPSDHPLSLIQYLDLKTYLVGDINTKVDRASMAHSLEVREPLMDHPLVEWLSSLPPELKLRGNGEGKYLLKKALEPYLPPEILYRPKMGFAVPLAQWFRGPLRQSREGRRARAGARRYRLVQRALPAPLVEDHQSGVRDYSAPLWTLLMFESFLRKVQTARRSPRRSPREVRAAA